jgi:dipeptide/tripeptide permease
MKGEMAIMKIGRALFFAYSIVSCAALVQAKERPRPSGCCSPARQASASRDSRRLCLNVSPASRIVITIGELYLSPVGLSLVTKVAPGRILSMMMGVWLATSFVGNFLAGFIGSFWSQTDKPVFFLVVAAIAAIAGAAIFACHWPLRGTLRE